MKHTMTIEKAQLLVQESELTDDLMQLLADAVAHAVEQSWAVVDFELTEDNIVVSPHTGVMVAWMLDDYLAERLRVEGGEHDLHVTLAYLGDVEDLTFEQQRTLVGVVSEVLEGQKELYGIISGTTTFPPTDEGLTPWYAEVNMPGLAELRERLVAALQDADLPVSVKFDPYTPHVTLAYLEEGQEPPQLELPPVTVSMRDVTVSIAGSRRALSLDAPEDGEWKVREEWFTAQLGEDYWSREHLSAYVPFLKSVVQAERRFTLGPWYIPDMADAHDEWTDADELQAALWRYVDTGYRGIHLQHSPDIVAGRWVEIMTLPWPMEVPIIDVNGQVAAHQYPVGTVMMGVIWDQWAWELVKSGAITGYSIGGNAARTDEQPPGAAGDGDTED